VRPAWADPTAAAVLPGPWRPASGPPAGRERAGTGRAFGTFGELLQGVLPDGHDFLVTLPIARWSVAVFRPEPGTTLRVATEDKAKSRALAARMLDGYGVDPGGVLTIDSALPVGKGMASSSADLVATARAIADAYGLEPSPEVVQDLLREIEPSDGVMYDSVVAFHHREVRLRAQLGSAPRMTVVGLDEGGTVDTVRFNRLPKAYTADDAYEYQELLDRTARAIAAGDPEPLGEVATRSAVLNQRIRPKKLLETATTVCRDAGALGVAAAHSGTKLGVLIAAADPDHDRKLARVVEEFRALGLDPRTEHTLTFDTGARTPAPRLEETPCATPASSTPSGTPHSFGYASPRT
jgi:L-threonine kinase